MEYSLPDLWKEQVAMVGRAIFPEKLSIPAFKTRSATYTVPVEYENYSEWETITTGSVWSCRFDEARWFEARVTLPESFAGKRVVLEASVGGEATVSINGEMKSALAAYLPGVVGSVTPRTRVDVTNCAQAGEVLNISIQANMNYKNHFKASSYVKYSDDITAKYTLARVNLCVVDDVTEQYYYDILVLLDAIQFLNTPAEGALSTFKMKNKGDELGKIIRALSRDSGLRHSMIEALHKSLAVIPFGCDEEIRAAAPTAAKILHEEMAKLPRNHPGMVYGCGFAHLDLVWLWQEKHSVRKMANTFLNVLALIERYPEFIFCFSQPYAFQWLEIHYPEIFKQVQEKVKAGNIDPIGNLWAEMDTNLASGEAIVRHLLYGRAYYRKHFGKSSDVFFMPDSFGFSASLPQIIKKSGIPYFYTSKLATSDNYVFPHTYFRWQGIDGTQILSYEQRQPYNGELSCDRLDAVFTRQENRNLDTRAFCTFGNGDGGGGTDYKMLEASRRLADMPGIPKLKMGTFSEFFQDISRHEKDFPIWDDELYLDRHRGTYTSHGLMKKSNRIAELHLRRMEMAASLREILLGIPYPAAQIEALWKRMLHVQFHDSLPGSAITQAMNDAWAEFDIFFREEKELFDAILSDLTASVAHDADASILWNFLPWQRQDQVLLEGNTVPVNVPAMGWTVASAEAAPSVSVTDRSMENRFFRLKLDDHGHVVSLIHKETGREALQAPSNVLEVFVDVTRPQLGAWDIHPEYNNTLQTLDCADSIEVVESSGDRGIIRVRKTYHHSTITQDITIYSNIDRVDFVTHVDWQENMRMLKAAFYPKVQTSRATYEIQFGSIERPTHRNTEYDKIRFEACAHKWADLSQNDFGVSLLNDCKYGYDILGNKMRISLLRAPAEPDYTADRGEHTFTYSLFPHKGNWSDGGTVQAAFELNVPLEVCKCAEAQPQLPAAGSWITTDLPNVVLDTVKKAEDGNGYILRIYEACGCGGNVTVTLPKSIRALTACNLMEDPEGPVAFTGSTFTFETTPYCIHTFRVVF